MMFPEFRVIFVDGVSLVDFEKIVISGSVSRPGNLAFPLAHGLAPQPDLTMQYAASSLSGAPRALGFRISGSDRESEYLSLVLCRLWTWPVSRCQDAGI